MRNRQLLPVALALAALAFMPQRAAAQQPAKAEMEAGVGEEGTPEEAAAPEAKPGKPVLVLPYQAIYRSVPQEKLDTATNFLQRELETRDGLKVIRGAVAAGDVAAPSLRAAEEAMKAAEKAEAERRIADAIELRKAAVASYAENAGALNEIAPFVEAHHRLARAYLLAGMDQEARDAIEEAARIAPAHELDRSVYPRLYQRWFKASAAQALSDKRGSVLVKSVLPGALIELDGRETEVAPVLLEKVVPGKHLVVARIEAVPPFAALVEVQAGKTTEVVARYANTMGGDEVGTVSEALTQNRIPTQAVAAAAGAAKKVGSDWVVLGAIARDDDKYRGHTFVVHAPSAKVVPLEVLNFDLEMLTAESDILRIVQDVGTTIDDFKEGQTALAMIERRAREQDTTNRFDASPIVEEGGKPSAKKKKHRRPVFRPLRGGKIEIKDEEE